MLNLKPIEELCPIRLKLFTLGDEITFNYSLKFYPSSNHIQHLAYLRVNHPFLSILISILSLFSFLTVTYSKSSLAAETIMTTDSIKNTQATYSDVGFNSPFSVGSHNFSIDVGQIFLLGNFPNYSNNMGTQIHYTYGSSQIFAFDANWGFSQHNDGDLSLMHLAAGIRYNLNWYDRIIPYIVFGMGFYQPTYRDYTLNSTSSTYQSSILFGLNGSFGADLQVTNHFFFGSFLTYHSMFTESKTFSDGNSYILGGSYLSFFVHTGLSF